MSTFRHSLLYGIDDLVQNLFSYIILPYDQRNFPYHIRLY